VHILTLYDYFLLRVTGAIVGHVGDGNFHTLILYDPNDDDEMSRAKTLANTISTLVSITSVAYVVSDLNLFLLFLLLFRSYLCDFLISYCRANFVYIFSTIEVSR